MARDVVVNLSAAEDEPPDCVFGARLLEHGLERAGRQPVERHGRLLQPEQPFRRHDDERTRGRVERLAPQEVEELTGGCAVRNADVVLRRELEEALEAGARMLGPVSLVSVREEKREPRSLPPLRAAGYDELVDDDLRSVDEVAELGFPENEGVRSGDRVAVLERERRVFREG